MEVMHGLGYQNYEDRMRNHIFYIDRTDFIREWWEYADRVTLITRPRRFGKTLNIDTGNKPSEETHPERFYHGFVPENIRKYGFGFQGQKCLVG